MGLQLLCVGLAGVVAATIVAAAWWKGTHCPRCGAAHGARRARQRMAARAVLGQMRVRTI